MGESTKSVKQPVKTIISKVSRLNDYRGGGFTIERLKAKGFTIERLHNNGFKSLRSPHKTTIDLIEISDLFLCSF